MAVPTILAFVNNSLLAFSLFFIFEIESALSPRWLKLRYVITGLLITAVCLLVMAQPFEFEQGLSFDTRTILISAAALIFGWLPATMAATGAVMYRVAIGGSNMPAAILAIVLAALLGLFWRQLVMRSAHNRRKVYWQTFWLGVVVQLAVLLSLLLLPGGVGRRLWRLALEPAFLLYPLLSFVLCVLLLRQRTRRARLDASQMSLACRDNLRLLFEQTPISCHLLDDLGVLLRVSRKWLATLGYTTDEVLGRQLHEFVVADQQEEWHQDFARLLAESFIDTELTLRARDGAELAFSFKGRVVRDEHHRTVYIYCALHNITRFRLAATRLQYHNQHDRLTGLYNREYFDLAVQNHIRAHDFPLAVIIGDIDGLKQINDHFGRSRGDQLIRSAGRLLAGCVHSGETIARVGGDEFWLLLPRASHQKVLARIRELNHAIEEDAGRQQPGELPLFISLAYGTMADASGSFEDAIREAEDYLYQRKILVEKSPHSAVMKSIITTMNEKSCETEAHAERLIKLTGLIGEDMGLSAGQLDLLHLFSIVHDIGKVIIPDHILNKPGRLTEEEWAEMRKHPEIGYRIAAASPGFSAVAGLVLAHHERWDGTGYPRGLQGEQIPFLSRILAVADAFDAMTAERSYRQPVSAAQAVAEIERCAGTQFDPQVARAFVRLAGKGKLEMAAKIQPGR